MLTKAYIVGRSSTEINKYIISIPSFGSQADGSTYTAEATVCYQPGNVNLYQKDDIVFVEFEGLNKSKPVIVGKLWLNQQEAITNRSQADSLIVNSSATLPNDTRIGNTNWSDFSQLVKTIAQKLGL